MTRFIGKFKYVGFLCMYIAIFMGPSQGENGLEGVPQFLFFLGVVLVMIDVIKE